MVQHRHTRVTQILSRIKMEQSVSIDELARSFGVSTATIRRDVKELAKRAEIVQTIGGSVCYRGKHRAGGEDLRRVEQQIRIAERCIPFVHPHDDLIVGPGRTALLVGRILSGIDEFPFRIVTNSLELALEVGRVENVRCVVLGGEVEQGLTVVGEASRAYLRRCHTHHTLFMGVDGIDPSRGVSVFDEATRATLAEMVAVSSRVVVVADAAAFGVARYYHVADWSVVTDVVTDDSVDSKVVETLGELGVQVSVV